MSSKIELPLNLPIRSGSTWYNDLTDLCFAIGNEEIENIFIKQTNVDARYLFCYVIINQAGNFGVCILKTQSVIYEKYLTDIKTYLS